MIELTSQSRVSKATQPCQSVLPPMQATLRVRWGKRWSSSTWASRAEFRAHANCSPWPDSNKFLHSHFPTSFFMVASPSRLSGIKEACQKPVPKPQSRRKVFKCQATRIYGYELLSLKLEDGSGSRILLTSALCSPMSPNWSWFNVSPSDFDTTESSWNYIGQQDVSRPKEAWNLAWQ